MSDHLQALRGQLNEVDKAIVDSLAQRMAICREVAKVKLEHDVAMMQPEWVNLVKERTAGRGAELGLDAEFVRDLYERIIREACRVEDEIMLQPGRATLN
jgi:chorismate mutase-like protein